MLEKFEDKYPVGSLMCYLVAFVAFLLLFSYGAKSITDEYRNHTDRTMAEIKDKQRAAATEVEAARSRVDDVGQTLYRVDTAISNSEERAREITAGVDRSKAIVRECQAIVEENRRIIICTENSNRERAEQAKTNTPTAEHIR